MNELNKSIANIPIPDRLKSRPISSRGWIIPWFVTLKDKDGEWDFRTMDVNRPVVAHRGQHCWVCGHRLGTNKVFSIGPMCAINRISSEPPGHLECERYAVLACPFLANPRMRRNTVGMPPREEYLTPGFMVERNPGVIALWTTKSYKIMQPEPGKGIMFQLGDPVMVEWWAEGRTATHAEVKESVETGLPFLREAAALQAGGDRALDKMIRKAEPIFAAVA